MNDYRFEKERISQHITRYCVDTQPQLDLEKERVLLQDYANWLITRFGDLFETLMSGPRQFRVNKAFRLQQDRLFEVPTFMLTPRGPIFVFPRRLYMNGPQDMNLPETGEVFAEAVHELQQRMTDHKVRRITVVNEFVFDTDQDDSLQIVAANFRHASWRQELAAARIQLEWRRDNKTIVLDIRPTFISRVPPQGAAAPEPQRYGVMVKADIGIVAQAQAVSLAELDDLLQFAGFFIPQEMLNVLNNNC